MLPSKAEIEHFLGLPDSIKKMVEDTKKGRPALETVIPSLMKSVNGDFNDKTIRQITGRLAKKVMEIEGYKVKERRIKLDSTCSPFITASSYEKR